MLPYPANFNVQRPLMKTRLPVFAPFVLLLAVALLYGGFLRNPIVFDDVYSFLDDTLIRYGNGDFSFGPRWLPYFTLGLSRKFFGLDLVGYRLPGLLLQVAVAIALYAYLKQLSRMFLPEQQPGRLSYTAIAFLAALIFALHPVAVYAAGYLIERTVVMATLFALLMWLSLLRGLEHDRTIWLWVSVAFYALALSSKEHVVMAPAVSAGLCLLWWRTHSNRIVSLPMWFMKLTPVFVAYAAMALYVVLLMKGYIARNYEILGADTAAQIDMGNIPAGMIYPLSVFNQAALFFKYLGLWLLPDPVWMSVDMRVPFATSFWVWPQTLGLAAFVAYPLMSIALIWRGGRLGLLGISLLAPWLLFATEIATVRVQEPFVLYRSYLWAAPLFAGLLVAFEKMEQRRAVVVLSLFALAMYPLAYQRLQTFSNPLLLWDDAAQLVKGKSSLSGVTRIYMNRGHEYEHLGRSEEAISDYNQALEEQSVYYRPYLLSDLGASKLKLKRYAAALRDFDAAIALKPDYPQSYMGRGQVLEALDKPVLALPNFNRACWLGWKSACKKTMSETLPVQP
jgi:tetratricopeptide (TPR) repeat protein